MTPPYPQCRGASTDLWQAGCVRESNGRWRGGQGRTPAGGMHFLRAWRIVAGIQKSSLFARRRASWLRIALNVEVEFLPAFSSVRNAEHR